MNAINNLVTMDNLAKNKVTRARPARKTQKKQDNSITATVASKRGRGRKRKATEPSPEPLTNPAESDVCSVCLDPPVHPATLECGHTFCYLCAKGLSLGSQMCSLCRKPIAEGYLNQSRVVQRSRQELDAEKVASGAAHQWYYEGNNGWWKFEERNGEEIEHLFQSKVAKAETMICGHIYVIDFETMVQYRKDHTGRIRRLKRDVAFAQCKGVAGLVLKK